MMQTHTNNLAPHRALVWMCRLTALSVAALLVAALRYLFYEVVLVEALVRLL